MDTQQTTREKTATCGWKICKHHNQLETPGDKTEPIVGSANMRSPVFWVRLVKPTDDRHWKPVVIAEYTDVKFRDPDARGRITSLLAMNKRGLIGIPLECTCTIINLAFPTQEERTTPVLVTPFLPLEEVEDTIAVMHAVAPVYEGFHDILCSQFQASSLEVPEEITIGGCDNVGVNVAVLLSIGHKLSCGPCEYRSPVCITAIRIYNVLVAIGLPLFEAVTVTTKCIALWVCRDKQSREEYYSASRDYATVTGSPFRVDAVNITTRKEFNDVLPTCKWVDMVDYLVTVFITCIWGALYDGPRLREYLGFMAFGVTTKERDCMEKVALDVQAFRSESAKKRMSKSVENGSPVKKICIMSE